MLSYVGVFLAQCLSQSKQSINTLNRALRAASFTLSLHATSHITAISPQESVTATYLKRKINR